MAAIWTCDTCGKVIPELIESYIVRVELPETTRWQSLMFCTADCVRTYFAGWRPQ